MATLLSALAQKFAAAIQSHGFPLLGSGIVVGITLFASIQLLTTTIV